MKASIADIVRIILLFVIAVELGYIALQLAPGPVPPWPHVSQYGKLEGDIPKHTDIQTIYGLVAYTACAVETGLKLQVALKDTVRAK